MLRRAVHAAASTPIGDWIVSGLERLDLGHSHVLPILTYHRILDPPTQALHGLCVPPAAFELQVDALSRRHDLISMADVVDARHGRLRLPRRALLLTFDDAYTDFETSAWPLLKQRSVPATLFVPTGYPDRPDRWFWWDRLSDLLAEPVARTIATPLGDLQLHSWKLRRKAFDRLRDHFRRIGVEASMTVVDDIARQLGAKPARNDTLGWERLRRLAADGVTVAPHSRSHAFMPAISDSELRDELMTSRHDLERELGTSPPVFAYPAGGHNDRVVAATDAAGYDVALTTVRGVNDLRRRDWLRLRRINVGGRTPVALLRAQVGSWMILGTSQGPPRGPVRRVNRANR